MRIAKQAIFLLACLPLMLILAVGAVLVAFALSGIYTLVAIFHPMGAEWSV